MNLDRTSGRKNVVIHYWWLRLPKPTSVVFSKVPFSASHLAVGSVQSSVDIDHR